jgi:peptide/nickel transport system ATP-binding protein
MIPALEVRGLSVTYRGAARPALDAVDLSVAPGQTLGVIGESGSGKSTLALALVGLVTPSTGQILYDGQPLQIRGPRPAQIVFQDPQGSFNPRRRAWQLIAEPLAIRGGLDRRALRDAAAALAQEVGVSEAQLDRWPHEFSGGQRQRLAIARAIATDPKVLILDEPTSALDVSIQAQVLNLLVRLQRERAITYVFISHDVAVVRHLADTVAVMHRGKVVEAGEALQVLEAPAHPYTRVLIAAVPRFRHEAGGSCSG